MPSTNVSSTGDQLMKVTMNLFGCPYQFTKAVDPRVSSISKVIGKKFAENILTEAPICTIIPGVPKYLSSEDVNTKASASMALLEAAGGSFDSLDALLSSNTLDNMRLYDFEPAYVEYMNYVNILCSAGASFLELEDNMYVNSREVAMQQFDWKNYKWNSEGAESLLKRGSSAVSSIVSGNSGSMKDRLFSFFSSTEGYSASLRELATNYQYVQFYVDPDAGGSDSLNNSTTESQLKSIFEQGSNTMKDIAFMANSGGISADDFNKFANDSLSSLSAGINQILSGTNGNALSQAGGVLSRLINLSGDVIKGHNIIVPDIYQNSSFNKGQAQITVHLKTPYGTKLGYFLNIFVPMMHLLALAMPRMQTSNSYSSPFLVKAYLEGTFSVNLGIVTDISITRVTDSFSVDGLPSEVDVSLTISDLYSDLSMSSIDAPLQFINNTSLIEYMATNCGMSLTKPNYQAKYSAIVNSVLAKFKNFPGTVGASIDQAIYTTIDKYLKLYN